MKLLDPILRILGATIVLLLLQPLGAVVLGRAPSWAVSGFGTLSNLLVVLALALVVWNSSQSAWKLAGTVFLLYFGINILNTLDEAILFKVGMSARESFLEIVSGFFTILIFSPLLVLILGRWKEKSVVEPVPLAARSVAGWTWRIVLGDLAYVFCYFVAGIVVFPFVKDFYASTALPNPLTILTAQILRGMVYIAAGLAVTSGMKGRPGRAALVLGAAFPILAGVAPLLFPNAFMPGAIRLAHGLEIGFSNFAYGVILGYLLTRRAITAPVSQPRAVAVEPAA